MSYLAGFIVLAIMAAVIWIVESVECKNEEYERRYAADCEAGRLVREQEEKELAERRAILDLEDQA